MCPVLQGMLGLMHVCLSVCVCVCMHEVHMHVFSYCIIVWQDVLYPMACVHIIYVHMVFVLFMCIVYIIAFMHVHV